MRKYTLMIAFLLLHFFVFSQVSVTKLLTDNKVNPLGVDAAPRLSWQLQSSQRNILQSAYELKIFNDHNKLVWQTGKVNSDRSTFVPYDGETLQPNKKYTWQVRVWDNKGKSSAWSQKASWQMGMMEPRNWKAKWIEPGYEEEASRPSPFFRKEFKAGKKIKNATAYITAHGMYEAFLNGKRIGDAYFTPGWTAYQERLQYQAYDVTSQMQSGNNAIGVILGNGWYRGNIGFTNHSNVYGKDIALLMQLNIEYTDGSHEQVITDETWKSSVMHIRYNEIYHGETINARLEEPGWSKAGFDDAKWWPVKVTGHSKDVLVSTFNEPIRKKERFKPVKIFTTPEGEQVIDFGQNLVGWVELKVKGNAGDTITLWHAEVLDKAGNFYTTNLRSAKAEDNYILSGKGEEIFEPHFTWHGFRYVRVKGINGNLDPSMFTAVAMYSDMEPTGKLNTSNALINQLQHNIEWGQKGNFLDVPTDCPQRDERLGWTGDAQVFARTATFNMNVHNFFLKWMKDVAADQVNGAVPFVVPNVLGSGSMASTGWADVATIVPYTIYLAYGDTGILKNQYESMKGWVDYMQRNSTNDLWNKGFHFGDWLFYRPDDDNSGMAAVTDKYLIAQSFYAYSTQLLINAARILNKQEDVSKYEDLLKKIKDAYYKEYVTPNGRLVSGTQTAYVLALQFDMLPETLRKSAARRLADNIQAYGNHLTTGFLGTPYLCHVLSDYGYDSVAYKLLLQETYPSWLYPVKMGATTIWERWDGIKPDGSFQTPGMNSYNHYAYGAIGDWMYRKMVGLDTDTAAPGYKKIRIKPHIGGNFTYADLEYETYYGLIKTGWKKDGEKLSMHVTIPANTTAEVFIPAADASSISENNAPLNTVKEIKLMEKKDGYVKVNLGSGSYRFEVSQ